MAKTDSLKPKILVVDDKPANLHAMEVVLKDMDIELISVTNGNEALRATLHHEFALALLDIQMPEMDGFELAAILRESEKTSKLPFIFVSAVYTDNVNIFKGYEKGAFSFIAKPFQPKILINKVNFFIEKHQQALELLHLNKSLEQKNQELEEINKEMEAFSYTVSHDLRAPLRALDGYSRILGEDYSNLLDEEGLRLLKNVQNNAGRMGMLIDDLLSFSRLGKKPVQKVEILMNDLVDHLLDEIKEDKKHKAKIIRQDLFNTNADRSLIKQVWLNLITNAIKYSGKSPNPEIEIGSFSNENEIIYYIRDNGVGFNMEYAHKLFNVFQRLHGQSEFEGTGIGLATTQRILVKHGGRIWAEAKINEGATFYFTLPII